MDNELKEKINEINVENIIWIIYIGIILLSWYSNSLEKKYYVKKDIKAKEEYRLVMIIIFAILLVIYIYFLFSSIKTIKNLKANSSSKKKELALLSLIASLLIAISGIILLYIAHVDNDIDVEIAFN